MLSASLCRYARGLRHFGPLNVRSMSLKSFDMVSAPYHFVEALKEANQNRAFVVFDNEKNEIAVSHPVMEPVANFLRNDKIDFDKHEGMFVEVGQESGALMGAFLWRTNRGQGCGGIRFIPYDSLEGYFRDGMRLSTGMGRKSALAGLWAGGGKGVVAVPPGFDTASRAARDAVFRDYGSFLTSLRGCYVAAEDSGVNVDDMDVVFAGSRYTTCISPSLGGSGNPSIPTAFGVAAAIEGALDFAGMGEVRGKGIAIQGLGNVGLPLAKALLEKGAGRIVGSDISADRVSKAMSDLGPLAAAAGASLELEVDRGNGQSQHGPLGVLQAQGVDVMAPCAWGGVLSQDTIPHIKAKIVCGAANNQLLTPADAQRLHDHGIIYVPDFVANRMGIVNCANEQYGRVGDLTTYSDPVIQRHFDAAWENSVVNITKKVLSVAQDKGITTGAAADELANHYAAQPHPIWGHRCPQIIRSMIEDGWDQARG